MAAQGLLDPTKTGKYPVILSDALLGKSSKETYTGVRYNHRPTLSSDTAPNTARLKKSGKDDSYNLGFDDRGDKYQYNGVRTTDDDNYVLIFDPARKAFVLHRVDSTFHMNVTRTPADSNVESLRQQFPQLEVKTAATPKKLKGKAGDKPGKSTSAKSTPTKARGGRNVGGDTSKSKAAPAEKSKPLELTLPDLTAPKKQPETTLPQTEEKKPKRPALSPVESEEDDDDDDGGLTVEYPEGNPAAFRATSQYVPPFKAMTRRFSEFAAERESDEDDFNPSATTGGYEAEQLEDQGYEEGDEYEEEDDYDQPFRHSPPQPNRAASPVAVEPDRYTFDDGDEDDDGDDALEQDIGDLEAALAAEFEQVQQSGGDGDAGHQSDSSVSEEE
ncbi:RNA polymerase II transcription elongation factor-domain-containing protein [Dichotomopilus funicola]|uniref:RNA polymerase II transcription elongation factor-domain-containing protein n=1 Tax=Dichotomopilus funicola TaxID=1934379 RepID=A0AAN6ZPE5_9PEZI|nr:RNA polymerase II transcription elongation factor-domain-containing protein [Dichotomopilus funicola]